MAYRRYGAKYKYKRRGFGRKRGYGKAGFRKMRKGRSPFIRGIKRFRRQGGADVELKSFDLAVNNYQTANDPYNSNQTLANWVPSGANWGTAPSSVGGGNMFCFTPGSSPAAFSGPNQTTGDNGVCLNAPSQGADIMQRLGRKITIRSIYLRMKVTAAATWAYNAGPPQSWNDTSLPNQGGGIARLLMVYDKQANGYPSILYKNEVLAQFGTAGIPGNSALNYIGVDAAMNLSNRERFIVLFDKTFVIDNIMRKEVEIVFFKKCRLPVVYNNTNVTNTPWANIQSGAIWLFGIGENGMISSVAPAASPSFACPVSRTGTCRIRFSDA